MKLNTAKVQLIIIFCLIIFQSCQQTDLLTENVLAGKIKTSFRIAGPDNDTTKYFFIYNSTGKLASMSIFVNSDTNFTFQYNIEYQTNKVNISDTASKLYTYYLQPGTNLIDSIIIYDHGQDLGGNKIIRDNINNIVKIEPARAPDPLGSYFYLDSFIYDGSNLKSYKYTFTGIPPTFSNKYVVDYDLTKAKRVDNDINTVDFNSNFFFSFLVLPINDFALLGISLGNTYDNAIASVSNTSYATPGNSSIIHYSYLQNTPDKLLIEYTKTPSDLYDFKYLENTYYP